MRQATTTTTRAARTKLTTLMMAILLFAAACGGSEAGTSVDSPEDGASNSAGSAAGDSAAGDSASGDSAAADAGDEFESEDDDLPDDAPEPEITQSGGVLGQPTHDTDPASTQPGWTTLAMANWALPTEEPEPIEPIGFPLESALTGGFTSNAFGCDSRCITQAQLQLDPLSTDVELSVTTNVATEKFVWVLPEGPYLVNGVPVYVGKVPTAMNLVAGGQWTTSLTGLDTNRTYRVVVGATDSQDNVEHVTTQFTTTKPDNKVQAGSGCYFECITSAVSESTNYFSNVDLVVETNTDVEFEFAVSKSSPGTIAGHPFLPNDVQLNTYQNNTPRLARVRAIHLEGDTTYHVVVRVTDELGQSQWATGSFKTDPAPPPPPPPPTDIFIAFERLHVHNDGDRFSKGEIAWAWQIGEGIWPDVYAGGRERAKFDDGDGYTFPDLTGTWVSLLPGERTPVINLTSNEADRGSYLASCSVGIVERAEESCLGNSNPAISPPLLASTIESFKRCSEWGISGPKANEACMVMSSQYINDDYVEFDVLISFTIAG